MYFFIIIFSISYIKISLKNLKKILHSNNIFIFIDVFKIFKYYIENNGTNKKKTIAPSFFS